MSVIKIRLKSGGREIELEGERVDMNLSLFEKWWEGSDAANGDEEENSEPPERRSKTGKKRVRRERGNANAVRKLVIQIANRSE